MAKSAGALKKLTSSISQLKKYQPKSYTPVLAVLLVVAAFLVGVLFTKVQYLEKGQGTTIPTDIQPTDNGQQPQAGQKVDVNTGDLPVLGNKDAKVTVIEFADFQCPFCEKWFTDVGANLIKDYVNTGKVKLAFRHFAFLGDESNWSAEASECANEQGKFWQYHDYLYEHQGAENSGAFSKDNLKSFAATLDLNTSQFNSCLDSGKYTKNVQDDTKAGQDAGVSGTPTAFVNGYSIVGAVPYSELKAKIDEELAK
ncbi:MAG: hypothetical protein A3B38_04405 [Candidatus Levybacteria bacterium RIFCSPLOWO2_01_FULL_36_13]|nr:MAG: hypothetical protein A2684_00150 [Candidatus Levybacteria bacterium RIFCSPHIGHO2_01_FULL_36_15b]OGH34070.1 MAG: hypothetical protein A3B38_04405 [Candidatus Levybacteria bacterium RIFCSPLOWO2_01_FULL_36_13]